MAFGRLASRQPDAPMSEINVTPMVDVMLVLLVIFILTAPLMTSAIRLDLPRAEGGEAGASPQAVSLVVDAQGTVYWNDRPIAPEALRLRLAEAAKRNPNTELELRADESVQDQECALRFVQGWNACLEACKSAATPPTEPAPQAEPAAAAPRGQIADWMPLHEAMRLARVWTDGIDLDNSAQWKAAIKVLADEVAARPAPQAEPAAVGELPPLPDGRIVEIRDEHLPSQGETFDCIAFARAVEREVRSALASAPHAREPLSDRAAQDDAYVCGRNEEAKRWEKAMHQTWQVVNPLNPAGQPGSYSRGYDNGFAAALEVLHGNLK